MVTEDERNVGADLMGGPGEPSRNLRYLGRFHSVDPVEGKPGAPQSWNRFTYVSNRPLVQIDSKGTESKGALRFAIEEERRDILEEISALIGDPPGQGGDAAAAHNEFCGRQFALSTGR